MFNFFERKDNSIKSIPLSGLQDDFFAAAGPRDDGTISPQLAYAGVPFVYRAVNLRAYALASLPFSLARNGRELDKEGDEYLTLANQIKNWLFALEANLCIFGAAYLLIEKNKYGQNPTPRPVLPTTITPMYDMPSGELAYFERVTNGVSMRVELEDMLHFWLHSFQHENAPGTSPLGACLGSAATLHNLGRFAQNFFANGALMPTVFFFGGGSSGLPSTTTPQEIETFLERMKRLVSGIKNAWRFEALRGDVTAQQIGTPPGEVAAPDLTSIARQDVSVSFGIPESLLLSTSSTYASASADMYHVYDLTIIPEAESVVLPSLQRWLDTIGLTLTWQPEMLESYQSYQQHQAMSIAQLVGQPVLTQEEGRAILGYGPIESDEGEETAGQDVQLTEAVLNSGALSVNELRGRLGLEPVDTSEDEKQRNLSRQLEILKQATDAGLTKREAAALVGLELIETEEDESPVADPTPPPRTEEPSRLDDKKQKEEDTQTVAIRSLAAFVAEQTAVLKQLTENAEVADLEHLLEETKALTYGQQDMGTINPEPTDDCCDDEEEPLVYP
jgi:HK97 family phage portal protein